MKELSLVVFTVTSQAAAGVAVAMVGIDAIVPEPADGLLDRAAMAVAVLAVSGLALSLLHLRSPLRAPWALANLRRSWLSREILCALLFAAAGSAMAAYSLLDLGGRGLLLGLEALTFALGLALVGSMAMAYRLRTVPSWDTWRTPAAFFSTAFLLGALLVGVLASHGIAAAAVCLPLLAFSAWLHRDRGLAPRVLAAILCVCAAGLSLHPTNRSLSVSLLLAVALFAATVAEVRSRVAFYERRPG